MALSKRPGASQKPVDSVGVVDISSNPKRRVEVDTGRLPLTRLLVHAEGYRWTVKAYYRRDSGMDNVLDNLDLAMNDASQQYTKVIGQVIKVSSPLTPNQDVESKWFNMDGEGYIDAGIKPNTADIFVATVGDGRDVIFLVTETEQMSAMKEASYRTTYKAMQELTFDLEDALEAKVVKSYVYSEQHLERTGDTLIEETEYLSKIEMQKKVEVLKSYYLQRMWDNGRRSVSVPNQGQPVYDRQVASYMRFLGVPNIEEYNHPPFEDWRLENLYTLLKKPDIDKLRFLPKNFGILSTNTFYGRRSYGNVAFSGYKHTVFSGDYQHQGLLKNYKTAADIARTNNNFVEKLKDDIPYFKEVTMAPYVLSEGFYSGKGESILEVELLRFIKGEEIDIRVVQELYEASLDLSPIEFFYYVPLVLTVMLYVGM